jgi:hypothetical protein
LFKGKETNPYGNDLHTIWFSLTQGTRIYSSTGNSRIIATRFTAIFAVTPHFLRNVFPVT